VAKGVDLRISRVTVPTLREDPADAEVSSHALLIRAGMMRQIAAGIYSLLPLGLLALVRVEEIVRDEMNKKGACEIALPYIHPADVWIESERWFKYGPEMMRLKDRQGRDFCLGPTAEELVTKYFASTAPSYKDLPINIYQIQTKFRDEPRPRYGLLRAREFRMMDAYSFHTSSSDVDKTYEEMHDAYLNIARRCSLDARVVEASTGLIGGDISHEFMVISQVGEDVIVYCKNCNYGANAELERHRPTRIFGGNKEEPISEVHTPGIFSVDDVASFLGITPERVLKCVLYVVQGEVLAVFVPGYRDVSEEKLKRFLGTDEFHPLRDDEREIFPELTPGFTGPVGLKGARVLFDLEVKGAKNLVCGANKEDYHLTGVDEGRDFMAEPLADIACAVQGDGCPECDGYLEIAHGIEIGHIFKLGLKYSEVLGANFTDRDGSLKPAHMGTYGIGTTRILQTIVEQHRDSQGIRWPKACAPLQVEIIVLSPSDPMQNEVLVMLEGMFKNMGIQALVDEREVSAGVKFNDADLIGLPLQVVVGSKVSKGMLDLKIRYTQERGDFSIDNAAGAIKKALDSAP